jgi:hypothetical protein
LADENKRLKLRVVFLGGNKDSALHEAAAVVGDLNTGAHRPTHIHLPEDVGLLMKFQAAGGNEPSL